MKTMPPQETQAVSGGSTNNGDWDSSQNLPPRCVVLRPMAVPQRNPLFLPLPVGPTTDPVNPIEPVELGKPRNEPPGPTTDPVWPSDLTQ